MEKGNKVDKYKSISINEDDYKEEKEEEGKKNALILGKKERLSQMKKLN